MVVLLHVHHVMHRNILMDQDYVMHVLLNAIAKIMIIVHHVQIHTSLTILQGNVRIVLHYVSVIILFIVQDV